MYSLKTIIPYGRLLYPKGAISLQEETISVVIDCHRYSTTGHLSRSQSHFTLPEVFKDYPISLPDKANITFGAWYGVD